MREVERPERVYRLGRRDDPWAWPDWAYAEGDGTFGNRFDDPKGIYRVLYAATERLGTFVESLGHFRPDPSVFDGYEEIVGEDGDDEPPAAGEISFAWLGERCLGEGRLVGAFADIGHYESLAELRSALGPRVVHYGIHDLDAAASGSRSRGPSHRRSRGTYSNDRSTGSGSGTGSPTTRDSATTCTIGRCSNRTVRSTSSSRCSTRTPPTWPRR
ncbi:MAG TPA: RES domain-containing protein [Acidimicrobiales bacterium]|nr:RES domain-containing protein [Acidimicrobiales bacterium]